MWGNDGKLIGFGGGTRKVFRSIAHQLRTFHNAGRYCGDLINRVSIRVPDLVVSFTACPQREDRKKGIESDMNHFRYMLAMLINDHLKKRGSETEFIELPIGFNLFFSPSFLSLPVKDGSYIFSVLSSSLL